MKPGREQGWASSVRRGGRCWGQGQRACPWLPALPFPCVHSQTWVISAGWEGPVQSPGWGLGGDAREPLDLVYWLWFTFHVFVSVSEIFCRNTNSKIFLCDHDAYFWFTSSLFQVGVLLFP